VSVPLGREMLMERTSLASLAHSFRYVHSLFVRALFTVTGTFTGGCHLDARCSWSMTLMALCKRFAVQRQLQLTTQGRRRLSKS
jgi:hypothetical protein